MTYDIPGQDKLTINTIILDLNGTLSVAGIVQEGVQERLLKLKEMGFKLILFTGNTRGDADQLCGELGIEWKLAKTSADKRELTLAMEPGTCASIGNGLIDLEMMKVVKLSILTLQSEGVCVQTLLESDILVPSINDALDLFIDSNRLVATLRK